MRQGMRRAVQAVAAACLGAVAGPVSGQALTERPPTLDAPWVAAPGVLQFNFVHRFQLLPPPVRKVLNSPTFLLAGGLFPGVMAGARYASNSLVAQGDPNELELFGRWRVLDAQDGAPVDMGITVAWNEAAESVDAELALARRAGPLRLVGGARVLGAAYDTKATRWAVGGGAVLRLHAWAAAAADATVLLDGDERAAWSAGLHLRLPYTPHTLSLNASNAHTTTLQGSARGGAETLWGFEFTVPLTLPRYFGGGASSASNSPESDAPADAEVTMDNQLRFLPDTVRIRAGQTIRWRNTSDLMHTVTADPGRAARRVNVRIPEDAAPFHSGELPPGAAWSHTFRVPGVYAYVCLPHELAGMVGVVIVQEP